MKLPLTRSLGNTDKHDPGNLSDGLNVMSALFFEVLHLAQQLDDSWSFFSQCMSAWNKTKLCVGKFVS